MTLDSHAPTTSATEEPTTLAAPTTPPVEGPTEDPTDAPDVGRSALGGANRWHLAGAALQIVVATIVIGVLIVSPDDVSNLVAVFCGVALIGVGLVALIRELRTPEKSRLLGAFDVSIVTVGVLMVADPARWLTPIGRVVGLGIAAFGLVVIAKGSRIKEHRWPRVRLGLFMVIGGVLFAAFAETLFETAAVIAVLLTTATSVVRAGALTGFVDIDLETKSHRPVLVRWIDKKGRSVQLRDSIYEQVFFEGPDAPSRIGRFFLMMLFASVISAAGVLSDSTAVVIGAMLVAPLISPMMGMGLSLATGWPHRLGRSTLIVLGGIFVAVATGWLLAATGLSVDLVTNSQITSRSSPRVVDLVIAVAAGAAGAYAISRKDASSSLPGVAVAIALVPPLSVVGITAEGRDWEQAAGTLVLFTTNLVAIILAGGVVFVLTGVVPLHRFVEHQHRVRTSLAAVGVLSLLVVGALVINGRQIAEDSLDQNAAWNVVGEWLGPDSEFEVVTVTVTDGDVQVVLAGPGTPPSAELLASDLSTSLRGSVKLDLQWIPRQRLIVSSD